MTVPACQGRERFTCPPGRQRQLTLQLAWFARVQMSFLLVLLEYGTEGVVELTGLWPALHVRLKSFVTRGDPSVPAFLGGAVHTTRE